MGSAGILQWAIPSKVPASVNQRNQHEHHVGDDLRTYTSDECYSKGLISHPKWAAQ